jgi:hypothetical protein
MPSITSQARPKEKTGLERHPSVTYGDVLPIQDLLYRFRRRIPFPFAYETHSTCRSRVFLFSGNIDDRLSLIPQARTSDGVCRFSISLRHHPLTPRLATIYAHKSPVSGFSYYFVTPSKLIYSISSYDIREIIGARNERVMEDPLDFSSSILATSGKVLYQTAHRDDDDATSFTVGSILRRYRPICTP